MEENNQTKLLRVIKALNQIEVHGKENLSMLFACIQYLEGMANETPEKPTESNTEVK